jgi:DNA-binding transcriptional LysR family regulator
MKLTFRQLHAFVTVARLGSFTRAAEEIHITQAGLSLLVKEMEERLGFRLFDRTTRAVRPTIAGAKFLPVVTHALQQIDEVAGRLLRDEEQASHLLNVGATPLLCGSILPAVIAELRTSHPHIRIVLKDVERSALPAMVESGDVDLGLGILLKAVSGIQRQSIHQLSLLCIAPPADGGETDTVGRGSAQRTWSDLRNVPLIALPSGNVVQQLIDRHLKQIGRANEPRTTYRNMLTVIGMVEAGAGYAVLPSFVRAACERYRVRVFDLLKPRVPVDLHLITKRGTVPPRTVQTFVEAVSRHLRRID